MQLNIHIPDNVWQHLESLSKAELLRLMRTGAPQTPAAPTAKKESVSRYFGSIKGVYASVEEADEFIRNERDSWE